MNYYIFGAGSNSYGLIKFFGKDNVIRIVDNDVERVGEILDDVDIISFNEFIELYNDEPILISPLNNTQQIIDQLSNCNITNYYKCPPMIESYYDVDLVLKYFKKQYKKIVFYGLNPWSLNYCRLLRRNHLDHLIKGIIQLDEDRNLECDFQIIGSDDISLEDILANTHSEQVKSFNSDVVELYKYDNTQIFAKEQVDQTLLRLKNINKGKKCFLIGNGPSLTANDLNLIRKSDIDSFGCNRIYKIFPKTEWRPDYYFVVDSKLIESIRHELHETPANKGIFTRHFYNDLTLNYFDNVYRYKLYRKQAEEPFTFSVDVSKGVTFGCSVIIEMVQIAVYMGYEEIYLLGVDFSYIPQSRGKQHFYENDGVDKFDPVHIRDLYYDELLNAFEESAKYAEMYGIRIFNSTRGGELEVFKRVKLEDAIRGDKNE